MRRLAPLLCLALSGCTGTLTSMTEADAGPVARGDAGPPPTGDAGPAPDAGRVPPGVDAGRPPDPVDAGVPPGPCDGVMCGANATCDPTDGECRCAEGFTSMGGDCVALPPGDPATRSETELCDAWRDGRVENASPAWTAGATTCDPGTLSPDGVDDTLRRINQYRWLSGLGPVTHNATNHDELMECALMMHANNRLSHSPPTDWQCYTAGGASAAGRSNIALGYRTAAASIDGYMGDVGTMSLGHRRWILGARLGQVEIGSAGRGHCLGVFGGGGSTTRAWSAYPNQGVAPVDITSTRRGLVTWSVQAYTIRFDADATVEVTRVSDGASLAVDVYQTGGFGPPPTLAFTPDGWVPAAGETYRVTVRGTSIGDLTYEVRLVSC